MRLTLISLIVILSSLLMIDYLDSDTKYQQSPSYDIQQSL
jgi:hypothetical protein